MKNITTGLTLTLAFLAACTPAGQLNDARFATGSNTMVASSDYAAAYAVNTEAGTVSRVDPRGGQIGNELTVGLEPTRITRAGDRVFVTLRGERAVAVLQETPAGLVEEALIPVGAEPYGIVSNEAGTLVYVANSMSDSVMELDARSYEVVRTWSVGHEPRYLALHPSGKTLFVGATRGAAELTVIDLTADADGAVGELPTEPVALPTVVKFTDELDPQTGNFATIDLTPRLTGDIAISPNGHELVIPVLYVDNITPVTDPELSETGEPIGPVPDGYGAASEGISRFNPAVAVVGLDAVGTPDVESAKPVFISGFREDNLQFEQIRVRSYPSSVVVAPDNLSYVVTMQGSDTVAVVGALPFDLDDGRNGGMVDFAEPMPAMDGEFVGGVFTSVRDAGFAEHPKQLVWTNGSAGPDGVLFLDDENAYVHGGFDRTVSNIDFGRVFGDEKSGVVSNGKNGFDEVLGARVLSTTTPLTDHRLPSDIEAGRRLFYSATAPGMVASGAGVSCASCHFDGRNDGLTWTFSSGVRQTPMLAGEVSKTAPVTWTSQVDSVAHEAQITTEARMGGEGLSDSQLAQIAAFVDWTRVPDTALHGEVSEQIQRGKAIFEREDVACASCHSGESYTNNTNHDMFGLQQVNTPTLLGIAASAPYLHDGRAATLRDVLEWSRNGEMGNTSSLSESEMEDLEAYLRSL
ncbi:MAG: c-type cytochrome [Alphaproteobacteria bacterium]|nr:c-type cytochrome [Alphaproteobacteria bacterium]